MSQTIEVKLPDIGEFKDVPVIEILVKPGDTVRAEDGLVTLESEKATIDVPSPAAGKVKEISVKIGDKVSEGSLILLLETADEAGEKAEEKVDEKAAAAESPPPPQAEAAPAAAAAPQPAPPAPAPAAASREPVDLECDLLVLGAGPGGYSAAFRAADLGMSVVLVERYPTLGGVCLNVGCIPSKALLHVAAVIDEAARLAAAGVSFAKPDVDLDKLRAHKSKVVGKLTGGLAAMAKARKVRVIQGMGRFIDGHRLAVEGAKANTVVGFSQAIIATGSSAVKLPFMPRDPRIVDATGALELPCVPRHLLIIGGGIIGLEMATVYSTLGARISVVEMQDGLMPGTDRDLVKVFEQQNRRRLDKVMLKTRVTSVVAEKTGLIASFEGVDGNGDKRADQERYDMILVAVGRTPNGRSIAAEAAGIAVDQRGFIRTDRQMRTNVAHVFAIGDVAGEPMLAHKASHEGHVAAEAAAGRKSYFDARVIPSVAYTDPEIAWVGATEAQCQAQGIAFEKSVFPWAASGRAIANGAEYGFTKLLFDPEGRRIIGGAIVGPSAGDLISEIALAIEMGSDAIDIGKTIHPHPTLSESIGLAAEAIEGVCTDLPPPRKKS